VLIVVFSAAFGGAAYYGLRIRDGKSGYVKLDEEKV
jgi:hypothetical protein